MNQIDIVAGQAVADEDHSIKPRQLPGITTKQCVDGMAVVLEADGSDNHDAAARPAILAKEPLATVLSYLAQIRSMHGGAVDPMHRSLHLQQLYQTFSNLIDEVLNFLIETGERVAP
jgi:hypothetical protein